MDGRPAGPTNDRGRLAGPFYDTVFNAGLSRLDPERSHHLASRSLRLAAGAPGARRLAGRHLSPPPSLATTAFGLDFATPLTVAAGFDKNALTYRALGLLGFGAIEVGTVTALPQPGNPARPRITRLPKDRALLNAMGFPNEGCEAVARRLGRDREKERLGRDRGPRPVLGVNIGKSKAVEVDAADDDYRHSTRALAPYADYLTLNVSSPNTPGLRTMQAADRLAGLIGSVREELAAAVPGRAVPLLIKLAPDLADSELTEIAAMALELRLDGIIAVNTTIDHSAAPNSGTELAAQTHGGGISGAPLKERALEVLRLLRAATDGRITLVSAGGIEHAEDAWRRILAGASLVQAYTAFVYGGPLWPRRVNRGLAELLAASPWSTINDAVGKEDV